MIKPTHSNLVAMQQESCSIYADQPLYGTKQDDHSWQWINFGDFAKQVDFCRAGLAQLGVGSGDKVAIISNNCIEWAVTAYASYGLEALYVPMYLNQHTQDWKFIINECEAKVLLTTQAVYQKLHAIMDQLTLEHIIVLDGDEVFNQGDALSYKALLALGKPHPITAKHTQSEEPCCIIYTSGTTGKPKGVLISHCNICYEISAGLARFEAAPSDRTLSFLPWAHIYGHVVEVHTVIQQGMSSALVKNLEDIVDDLSVIKPTIFYAVPRLYSKIYTGVVNTIEHKPKWVQALFYAGIQHRANVIDYKRTSMKQRLAYWVANALIYRKIRAKLGGRLRIACSGASALNPEVTRLLVGIGIPIYQGYGLTETTAAITVNHPGAQKFGSAGKPLPDTKVVIDKAHPKDRSGEIICYGPNVMRGYFKHPLKTKQAMTADGGFKTGDIGRLDKDGFLYITGRMKEQFKLENGKFVAPSPIEETIKLNPLFSQVLIYGESRPYVIALTVVNAELLKEQLPEHQLDASHTNQHLINCLDQQIEDYPKYMHPKKVIMLKEEWTVDNELLTPTLKIKRHEIEKMFKKQINEAYLD